MTIKTDGSLVQFLMATYRLRSPWPDSLIMILLFILTIPGFSLADSQLWNCHINSMANQIWNFHIYISKMTSKSQYEKNLDAFAPYYYDDENHIDSLTPLIWRRTTAAEGLRNCFFLNTNKIQIASSSERFANLGEAEIQKLLEDKDSLNTKRLNKSL
jgi:hypothetical protein